MLDLHCWLAHPKWKESHHLVGRMSPEQCGLDYNVAECNIGKGDQFTEEFLKINPNTRMSVLVDHEPGDDRGSLSVFESGAIMLYLAEKTGQFMPTDPRGKYEVVQWVMWQMGARAKDWRVRSFSPTG